MGIVAIKKVDVDLNSRGEAMENGFTYLVETDILKEAETLKHLTEHNCNGIT